MSIHWQRITKHVWRLDDHWQVVQETPGQWRAYRGDLAMLADFRTAEGAMQEAERLRDADKLYELGDQK